MLERKTVKKNLSSSTFFGGQKNRLAVNSEISIFANSVKRHICDGKISRPGHDLHVPISVNDRLISPYCKSFIFRKLRISILAKVFLNLQHYYIAFRMLALSIYHVVGLYNGRIHHQPISHNKKLSGYCAQNVSFINIPCCRLV